MKQSKSRFLVAFLVFALFMQAIGAFFYFDYFADVPVGKVFYLITKILLIALPIIFWKFFKENIKQRAPKSTASLAWGTTSGLLIMAVIYGFALLMPELIQSSAEQVVEKIYELKIENYFILFAVFLSLIHSLIEELYWRWFVFRGLRLKMNYRLAALISSIAFAGHHFILLKEMFPVWATILFGVSVGLGGYIWCEIYQRTGSLKGAWISHAMADLAIMSLGYFMLTGI